MPKHKYIVNPLILNFPSQSTLKIEAAKIIDEYDQRNPLDITVRRRGGFHNKILGICGNGGSLAQASHLAGELIPLGYPCIAFNDQSVMSAIANDINYRSIFATQITAFRQCLFRVIILTTSGTSKNTKDAIITTLYSKIPITIITGIVKLEKLVDNVTLLQDDEYKNLITHIRFRGDTPEIQEQTLKFIHHLYKEAKK